MVPCSFNAIKRRVAAFPWTTFTISDATRKSDGLMKWLMTQFLKDYILSFNAAPHFYSAEAMWFYVKLSTNFNLVWLMAIKINYSFLLPSIYWVRMLSSARRMDQLRCMHHHTTVQQWNHIRHFIIIKHYRDFFYLKSSAKHALR